MTDWTKAKPGTKVWATDRPDTPVFRAPRGVFIGATSEGNPVIEVDSGAVFAYGKDKWEPVPETVTVTLLIEDAKIWAGAANRYRANDATGRLYLACKEALYD